MISFLLAGKSPAQPWSSTLQQQAYQAVQASVMGDYNTVLTYTYPGLVKLVGGPQNMLALLKQQAFPAISQPIHVLIEQPGPIYPAGKELHALVPYLLTIPQKQKSIRLRGYQLALSANLGRHWYFVPTDQLTEVYIHLLFPNFNPRLKLPQTRPLFRGQS